MSIVTKIRRGEGPYWGFAKAAIKRCLTFHVPVNGVTRPAFRLLYSTHVAIREGMAFALRVCWYEPLFRSQCERIGSRFRMEQLPYIVGRGRIVLGDGVALSGKSGIAFANRIDANPQLVIGDRVFIGHGCGFAIAQSISIGNDCLIAGGVSIRDNDGHPLNAEQRRQGDPVTADGIKPVVIGNDVWIGQGAIILKGVTIGDRSIVAGGAIVTAEVPPDVVVGGSPARVIRNLAMDAKSTVGLVKDQG